MFREPTWLIEHHPRSHLCLRRRRQFPRRHVPRTTDVHPTLRRLLRPPRGSPRLASATAGRRLPFQHLPQGLRLRRRDRLHRRLRPRRRSVESRPARPGRHRLCLFCIGTAMKVTRKSLSMRVTMTRILPPLSLTRMRSRPTSVSRASRTSCRRGPQRQRRLLLPFPRRHLLEPGPRPSRASPRLYQTLGNPWICLGELRLLLLPPRRRRDTMTSMILTTTPRLPPASRQCLHTRFRRLLRT